jgi:hypothetical protein
LTLFDLAKFECAEDEVEEVQQVQTALPSELKQSKREKGKGKREKISKLLCLKKRLISVYHIETECDIPNLM